MESVYTCRLMKIVLIIVVLNGCTRAESVNVTNADNYNTKKNLTKPSSVDSRFFDLGSLFNQFFPGINSGNQGRYTGSPGGGNTDYPGNQYYPGNQNQFQGYEPPRQQTWPYIDDAKTYPGKGHIDTNQKNVFNPQQSQYPNQRIGGGYGQYPNPGNGPGYYNGINPNPDNQYQNQDGQYSQTPIQYPNQINGPYQNPGQNNFGNQYPGQRPINAGQYPDQGNFGGSPAIQNPGPGYMMGGQNPSQENFGGSPAIQTPGPGYMMGGQNPSQGNFGGRPVQYPNPGPSTPDQSNFVNQYPNPGQINGGQYPMQGIGNGGPMNQFPDQGIPTVQQTFRPDSGQNNNDGTLDGVVSPEQTDFNSNQNGNAILGKPVNVPMSTIPPGQFVYPQDSIEDPSKVQCSQDCQTTSEYRPVCGSNNITYYNPGRFICARNCGINVFVVQQGRCPGDAPPFVRKPGV